MIRKTAVEAATYNFISESTKLATATATIIAVGKSTRVTKLAVLSSRKLLTVCSAFFRLRMTARWWFHGRHSSHPVDTDALFAVEAKLKLSIVFRVIDTSYTDEDEHTTTFATDLRSVVISWAVAYHTPPNYRVAVGVRHGDPRVVHEVLALKQSTIREGFLVGMYTSA
jgi:hypothetical protein